MNFDKYVCEYPKESYEDKRGHLNVLFEDKDLGVSLKESFSKKNVFRGMHIQRPPFSQIKHIQVLSGAILDFILILDFESPDFGKIFSKKIKAGNSTFVIPNYCAHGFLVLDQSVVRYLCMGKYSEMNELAIEGVPPTIEKVIISKKDSLAITKDEALDIFKTVKW